MNNVEIVAETLSNAWRKAEFVDALPLAKTLSSAEEAYEVQAALGRHLGWFGDATPRHWKSGGPSRSVALTHAPLPPAGVWASAADARKWPFIKRFVEAEVALRLGHSVTAAQAATLDRDAAVGLVDAMVVSIEIVDSRWQQGFDAPALLRLADMQSHGALVLGEWQPLPAGALASRDWSKQHCYVQIGDRISEHRGTHSCGDPAWVLPEWLRHATRGGVTLPAGGVVTTGTWCGALKAKAGEAVIVRFEGIGEASVQL